MKARRVIAWGVCTVVLFGVCAGLGAFCRFEFGSPKNTCALCHEIRGSRDRWSKSPHRNVNCKV